MNTIIFRTAYFGEGPLLTEISLRSKSYWGYSSAYVEKFRHVLTIDDSYIHNWPVVVIEQMKAGQNEIMGYFSLKVIAGENRLDNLWLDIPFIGRGFGRLALQKAIERARDCGWSHFYLASEPKAVSFYEKFGGIQVGTVQSRADANLKLPHIKFVIKQ